MKYFVEGSWWTDLGRRIKMNDLLNEMRKHLKELQKLQKRKTK